MFRFVLLKIHLGLGLAAALFLIILGLTGSIIAFETDIEHWVHPQVWYVHPGPQALPESRLIAAAEAKYGPHSVSVVQIFGQPNLARAMQLPHGLIATVNPYTGAILGEVPPDSAIRRALGQIHQVHLRLVPDPRSAPAAARIGKTMVNYAGLALVFLVSSGALLWLRARRVWIKWPASWFRISFDLHHVIGLYAGVFLLIAAVTGVLIGFESGERLFYAVKGGTRPGPRKPPQSSMPPRGQPVSVDRAIEVAHQTMPDATVAGILLPRNAPDVITILMRVPGETSEMVHSSVGVDQYTGAVVSLTNFATDNPGYRAIRFNRSIHTGDIGGFPTHLLMSLSSLLLVVMVITGIVIWWKKLAI